ncbi:hypothetical protein QTG64_004313 [Vibrio vulnificus]|nr:hypothetical protein [Vibrio vulnificus]
MDILEDFTTYLVKATANLIPGGFYIVEAVNALEKKIDEITLNERLELIEKALISFNLEDDIKRERELLDVFNETDNYINLKKDLELSLRSDKSFKSYILNMNSNPSPDFYYFNQSVKIKFIHHLFLEIRSKELRGEAIDFDGETLNALISFSSKVAFSSSISDDVFVSEIIGSVSYGCLPEIWHTLGRYLLKAHKYQDALRCFITALDLGCKPYIVLLNIANTFHCMGEFNYALMKYKNLVDMYPFGIDARYRYAKALERSGELHQARDNFEIFILHFNERIEKGAKFCEQNEYYEYACKFVNKYYMNRSFTLSGYVYDLTKINYSHYVDITKNDFS